VSETQIVYQTKSDLLFLVMPQR